MNFAKAEQGLIPKFNRVLIETTGLADPGGVISTINNEEFCIETYRYDGTVTVLDGQFVREQLQKQYEAVKQIALADIILISKTDLIDADEIAAISEVARSINTSAQIHPMVKGHITPKIIHEIGPYKAFSMQKDGAQIKEWLDIKLPGQGKDGAHLASPIRPATATFDAGLAKPKIIAHTNIESFAIVRHEPINSLTLLAAVNLIQQQYGDSILRLKGIIDIEGQECPVVIHGVQGQLYPVAQLDAWPEGKKETKLVFIVRATVLEQIKHIFTQSLDNPDESTIDYYRQVINAADSSDDGVEEIDLSDTYSDKQ